MNLVRVIYYFIFQVGILGNAADFNEDGSDGSSADTNTKRRQMMIAFDMRYCFLNTKEYPPYIFLDYSSSFLFSFFFSFECREGASDL